MTLPTRLILSLARLPTTLLGIILGVASFPTGLPPLVQSPLLRHALGMTQQMLSIKRRRLGLVSIQSSRQTIIIPIAIISISIAGAYAAISHAMTIKERTHLLVPPLQHAKNFPSFPRVQRQTLDEGALHAQAAMLSRTLKAQRDPVRDGGPGGIASRFAIVTLGIVRKGVEQMEACRGEGAFRFVGFAGGCSHATLRGVVVVVLVVVIRTGGGAHGFQLRSGQLE